MTKIHLLPILLIAGATACNAQYSRRLENLDLEPAKLFRSVSDSDIKELRIVQRNGDPEQFGVLLSQLTFQTGVPIGVEVDATDDGANDYKYDPELVLWHAPDDTWVLFANDDEIYDDARKNFAIRTGSSRFEDVLDELVSQMSGYKWTITDGVVNIGPKKQESKIVTEFLGTRIKNLKVSAGTNLKDLFWPLKGAKELSAFKFYPNMTSRVGERKLVLKEDVEFSDLTVREILNRLARINMCGWYVVANPNDPDGMIRVGV